MTRHLRVVGQADVAIRHPTEQEGVVLGLDPLAMNPASRPAWKHGPDGPEFTCTIDFTATEATAFPGLTTNLRDWHAQGDAALGFAALDEGEEETGDSQTRRISFPDGAPPGVFVRLRIHQH